MSLGIGTYSGVYPPFGGGGSGSNSDLQPVSGVVAFVNTNTDLTGVTTVLNSQGSTITLVNGNNVCLSNQTTALQNSRYVFNSGNLTLTSDCMTGSDQANTIFPETTTGNEYYLPSSVALIVGTNVLNYQLFSENKTYSADETTLHLNPSTNVFSILNSGVGTTQLATNAVTFAKFQQISGLYLLGNATNALGNINQIGVSSNLAFTGGNVLDTVQPIQTISTPSFASMILSNSPTINYVWTCTSSSTGAGSWQINSALGGVTSITGTANEIIASSSTGAVTLSTPQAIATTSSPTFSNITASSQVKCATFQMTTSPTNTYVMTSDASGNGTWQLTTVATNSSGNGFTTTVNAVESNTSNIILGSSVNYNGDTFYTSVNGFNSNMLTLDGTTLNVTDPTTSSSDLLNTALANIYAASGGTGTVTSVSVVSANGFSGTVANPTTTPAITLQTTISGLLYGLSNAITAITPVNSAILNTNGSGVPSFTTTPTASSMSLTANSNQLVIGSTNLVTFTTLMGGTNVAWVQSNLTSASFTGFAYGNSTYVVGSASGAGLYYSTNGSTWTQSNISTASFTAPFYGNSVFVATTSSVAGIYYSTNGTTWTQSNITSGSYNSAYYASGVWVVGSSISAGIYYSINGTTWTQSNITSGAFTAAYYGNSIYVIGATSSNGIYYSSNGTSWTQSNLSTGQFASVFYGGTTWIAGGSNANGIYYSSNGTSWTQSNITTNSFGAIAYNGTTYVIGSNSNSVGLYYSTNGTTWTQTNVTTGNFFSVAYGNSIWMAGSGSTGLWYSTNGTTWTQSNVTSSRFTNILDQSGFWVAAGNNSNGLYYYNSNGTSATCSVPSLNSNTIQPLSSATSNNWIQYVDSSGVQHLSQPAYSNLSQINSATLIGNPTGAGAVPSLITLTSNLKFTSTTLDTVQAIQTSSTPSFASIILSSSPTINYIWTCTSSSTGAGSWQAATGGSGITALTGDVTASGTGSVAATIAANAVTYAKFQQVPGLFLIGNATGSTANAASVGISANLKFISSTTLDTVQSIQTSAIPSFSSIILTSSPTLNYVWTCTNASLGTGSWQAIPTQVSSITGTANQVIASASTGAVTLSLPQSIATSSTPQFGGLSLGGTLLSNSVFSLSPTLTNTGSVYSIYNSTIFSPSANSTLCASDNSVPTFNTSGGVTITRAAAEYVVASVGAGSTGIISNLYGIFVPSAAAYPSSVVTNSYNGYFNSPPTGTTGANQALYADNMSIGNNGLNLNGTNNLAIAGKTITSTFQLTTSPTNNYVLTSDASGNATWQPSGASGVSSITGTANQVIASASTGAVTLSLPQSIATTSSPTFAAVTTTGQATLGNTAVSNTFSGNLIYGVNNSTVASAGTVGEFTDNSNSGGTSCPVNTWTNIAQISLNAGDFDSAGSIQVDFGALVGATGAAIAVSLYSGNTTTDHVIGQNQLTFLPPLTGGSSSMTVPLFRILTNTSVIAYVKCYPVASSGTATTEGYVCARRRR
jgi:hypothetical protein